jgi:hypothetical protein
MDVVIVVPGLVALAIFLAIFFWAFLRIGEREA